jgi:oxygen-dependent protoporphyrinogen oxidase
MNALVLGGGISGLAHAHQLKKNGHPVLVLEASDRAGGVIRSEKISGHLLEFGPNTVLPSVELMALIENAGLSKEYRLADSKSPRYVFFNNRLHAVPMGPGGLIGSSLLSLSGKIRLFREPFIPPNIDDKDETLYDFSLRRIGIEATERLLAPFVSGVWAGDIRALSAESSFPKLVQWEKKHGSLIKGAFRRKKGPPIPKGLLSFDEGLQTLAHSLGSKLGDELHLNEKVLKIERNNSTGTWVVVTQRGNYTTDRLISSLPAPIMAGLCRDWAPSLSKSLEQIPYISITVLHLSVSSDHVGHSLQGFGFLAAPTEKAPVLGCLFSSSLFPNRAPSGKSLLTVFIKGQPDKPAIERAVTFIGSVLTIKGPLETLSVRTHQNAIPQYVIGHRERKAIILQAENEWPGLHFVGNYLEGISAGV